MMNFRILIKKAQNGDDASFEEILKMYRPLIMKESIINGSFDEDLFQEQCIVLNKCINMFKE